MVKVFLSVVIREVLAEKELSALVADFKRYKSTGILPSTFGRDVPYDHPHTLPSVLAEELKHLHLDSDGWPIKLVQWKRTSDTHLVYCQGIANTDHYALLAFLSPDAHDQAKNTDIMIKLAKSAGLFRDQY